MLLHHPQIKAEIVVSLEAPHLVVRANEEIRGLLDYSEAEILGRSIKILLGPQTDSIVIHSSIKSASFSKSSIAHVVLYGKIGQCRNVIVSCSPFLDEGGGLSGCLMLLESSEAIKITQALENNSFAKALISAEYPHMVQMVNDEFTYLFGFTPSQVMGRSLRTIHGPRTDSEVWRELLQTASIGRISKGIMYNCSSSCHETQNLVTCVPVTEADGAISNILVFFSPGPPPADHPAPAPLPEAHAFAIGRNAAASARFDYDHAHAPRRDAACAAAAGSGFPSSASLLEFSRFSPTPHQQLHRLSFSDAFPNDPAAAAAAAPRRRTAGDLSHELRACCCPAGDCHCGLLAAAEGRPPGARRRPHARPSCPLIFPRRKAADAAAATASDDPAAAAAATPPCPVSVSLDLLESLAELPIAAAAQRLRVSTTALKKACRKLGVDRWPYRKDRPTQAAGQNAAPPRDFDEAYVRKLHRKYGAAPRRAAPGKPG
eukprot:CAMPEP_0172211582 /NCGR_PEP_ID=MMETSP1050-20130122/36485_1 /TAXON_ID=233186 /ORGANISM="Cryptomonas curvata, Strain CCAP979/52" /LENGTH=487 /DNA_ID=CAMNT_0012892055 /DNA_START=100 /DNA_END=1559 /DNA_ORIENTATION=+